MRQLVVLFALAAALAASGVASAGGWATVGFSPLPDGTAAGGTWSPRITVLQHGRTPLVGLAPVLTIRDVDSGTSRRTTAVATSEPGVYEARIVFPTAGRWQVAIESGFGDSGVTYGPATIGRATGDGGSPALPFGVLAAAAAVALVLAAAGVLGARRLRKLAPAGR